jgi:hypothetical protein
MSHGKITETGKTADQIRLGEVVSLGDNLYKLPVYLNGYLNGPLAVRASVNGNIENVSTTSEITAAYDNDMLVLAGTDEFTSESPVCFVTVKTNDNVLKVSDIRFNDIEKASLSTSLVSVEENNDVEALSQNVPNPFNENTVISINLVQDGNYTLRIYDAMGNVVRTWNNVNTGAIAWDGRDDSGNKLSQGVYVYRLTGDNLSVSKKLVLSK